jgi:hypothetical protein
VGTASSSHGVQQPRQRIWAGRHAGRDGQPCTAFTACLQREALEQLGGGIGAAGERGQRAIEALGEDLARASWRIAEPASRVQQQAHPPTTPRQVERSSLIAAMPSSTQLTTPRTRHRRACRLRDENQAAILLDDDQHDLPAVCSGAKCIGHGGSHPRRARLRDSSPTGKTPRSPITKGKTGRAYIGRLLTGCASRRNRRAIWAVPGRLSAIGSSKPTWMPGATARHRCCPERGLAATRCVIRGRTRTRRPVADLLLLTNG